MKRQGGLFPKIVEMGNLVYAHQQARRGKSYYREVKMVNADQDRLLGNLQQSLIDKTFTTSPYQTEWKFDGRKERLLYKLPYYPDRIVQHALIAVCEPIWIKSYIRDTYQSIPGRGTSDARRRVWKHIKGQWGQYALKFDIKKYYPSIDNELLKSQIRRSIKCPDTLWLLDDIIDSETGAPIGNYTSQHMGNINLSPFDWWVKQQLRVKAYFRYCDDIVILGPSAAYCHEIRRAMFEKLEQDFNLSVKGDWQIFPIDNRGLDFVGYVFKPDSIKMRRNMANRFKAKAKRVKKHHLKMTQPEVVNGVMAYWGWVKHANAKALWKSQITPQVERVFALFNMKVNPLKRTMA